MAERDSNHRSRELDEVRRMLFPNLSPEEGWTRIDGAVEGASDEERWAAIEQTAKMQDLRAALLKQLRELREGDRE